MTLPKPHNVVSLPSYFEAVERVWGSWTAKRSRKVLAEIWFRGHADAAWPLRPGALRPPFDAFSEHRFRHDFYLQAQPFFSELAAAPRGIWDWYLLMQHYGVPTRLLDWTESALVALYFALLPNRIADEQTPACVWLLDPRRLNTELAHVGSFIPIYSDVSVAPYLPELWDESLGALPKLPVAIDPPVNSPRLAAQRGKFTVHGSEPEPLEAHTRLGDALQQLLIPAAQKAPMRRQFLLTGVNEGTLFPGLSGVAREITNRYARLW